MLKNTFKGQQSVGGGSASGMDDALAEHRQERVRVQVSHLVAGQRGHRSHLGPPVFNEFLE
jgi:hypothetical protein